MSKRKLLSVIVAGLFASAPAFAQMQSGDTQVSGSVSVGGLGSDINTNDKGGRAEEYRDLSGSAIEVIDLRARNRANNGWADLFMENLGRDDMYISLRGGQYDLWKGRFYTDWLRHRFVDNALTPYSGLGTHRAAHDVPAARHRQLEPLRRQLQAQGHRRLLRVAGTVAVVLPRRRQQREDRGHEASRRGERHEPGQRLRRPRRTGRLENRHRRRRGRLQHEDDALRARVDDEQVPQLRRDADVDEPVLRERDRHDVARAGEQDAAHRRQRDVPPAADELDVRGTLYLAGGEERRESRDDRAQRYRRRPAGVLADAADRGHVPRQGGEPDVHRGARLGADDEPRHPPLLQLQPAQERVERARVLRQRQRPARLHLGLCRRSTAAAVRAKASTSASRATTSASTRTGRSHAVTASASAGTTSTATSRAAPTTTTAARTSSSPSTRTRSSTTSSDGSSTRTCSAVPISCAATRVWTRTIRRSSSASSAGST